MATKVPRFRTAHNAHMFPKQREVFREPTLTLPDMTLSVRDILNRYAQGIPVSAGTNVPVYHGDEIEYKDIKELDFVDREIYIETVRQYVADLKARAEEASEQQQAAQEQEFRKRFETVYKEFNSPTTDETESATPK